mgnify:CR=1 FL=1
MKSRSSDTFKAIITLALPMIAEEILSTLLQYVDTAMVGRLGAEATSAVNLTATVNWLIGSLFSAFGVAVTAMISSGFGAGDEKRMKESSFGGFLLSLGAGFVICVISLSIAHVLPIWMNADEAIIKSAGDYFFIISLAIPFRSISRIEACALRAVKDSKTPMVINLSQNILNIILNYIFIYTLKKGVVGAAWATFISFSLGGVLMLVFALKNEKIRFRREDGEREKQKKIMKEAFSISIPAAATSTTSCLGHIVFASLVSGMGTITFAAHSIALSAETIFYVPGYALRGSTQTLIGISVGKNDKKNFKEVEHVSVLITFIMMTITGALLYFTAYPVMKIFTPDERVVSMGGEVLKLIALSEPIFGLMIVYEGICYGLGDTRFPFWIETIGAWGIRILFTLIGLRYFSISLYGVWICMLLDNVFRALMLSIPMLFGRDVKLFKKRRDVVFEKVKGGSTPF